MQICEKTQDSELQKIVSYYSTASVLKTIIPTEKFIFDLDFVCHLILTKKMKY